MTNQIKHYRMLAGLSRKEAAQALNITTQQFSAYERGENLPNALMAIDIAQVLETTVKELYSP